jgi:hypothetical protein
MVRALRRTITMFAGCYAGVLALASWSPMLSTWDVAYEESGAGKAYYVGVFMDIMGNSLSVRVNNEPLTLPIRENATFVRDGVMCKREDLKEGETVRCTVQVENNAAHSPGVIRVEVVMSLPARVAPAGELLSPGR